MLIGVHNFISFAKGLATKEKNPLHTIRIRATGLIVSFSEILYVDSYANHTIGVIGTDLSVNFIHINDL